jgi:hypothetical protein
MPGKKYRLRVRMKADRELEDAMDVSVVVVDRNDITHHVMPLRTVLEDIDLDTRYRWYSGTFTVPEQGDPWFAKTVWQSKVEGATCYLDAWSVRRADATGATTEDFAVTVNGARHVVQGALPEGEMREFRIAPRDVKGQLDIDVDIGGNRVGMFRVVYENPILWSDDASLGVESVGSGAYRCNLDMVSRFSGGTACLTPLRKGVKVRKARSVPFKDDYFTGWLFDVDELPRTIEVISPRRPRVRDSAAER